MKTRSRLGAALALAALGIAGPAQAAPVEQAPTAIRQQGSPAKYQMRSLQPSPRRAGRWAAIRRYGR